MAQHWGNFTMTTDDRNGWSREGSDADTPDSSVASGSEGGR